MCVRFGLCSFVAVGVPPVRVVWAGNSRSARMCVRNGRSGLAAQRLSDFRVGVADWVDEHTLLRRVRRADEAERKDELGTDQVAVPERRLWELTHPVARQQRP